MKLFFVSFLFNIKKLFGEFRLLIYSDGTTPSFRPFNRNLPYTLVNQPKFYQYLSIFTIIFRFLMGKFTQNSDIVKFNIKYQISENNKRMIFIKNDKSS